MKTILHYFIITIAVVLVASCAKDNYDAPSSSFSGRVTYKGEPLNIEDGSVRFQLWEKGWGKLSAIDVPIKQDGSFSAVLFDGNYKMTVPSGDGPFKTVSNGALKDTIEVSMRGSQTMDVEVLPYYMVRNARFSQAAGKVTGTCTVEKIITNGDARDVERVTLYINKSNFVSNGTQIANANLEISPSTDWNNVSISVAVPDLVPRQDYVFARIGVKIAGIEDMIFSPITKVQL
ncbi:DUF3823 domain-containing protein [Arcticibacter sp. MXS-1]|uniref:DUF3823 domain-containing protein n=1 Tax=Arcticibacter sp. MXS-1 TaxID=3341726 RepID=UPI0035A925C1